MIKIPKISQSTQLHKFLEGFSLDGSNFSRIDPTFSKNRFIIRYLNEFWTSKQRQGSSIHEISYRACFKSQLPNFFINLFSEKTDIVYDPFGGRGTTIIEAGLLGRQIIQNDINPLSKILAYPRLFIPTLSEITDRLDKIPLNHSLHSKIDLSMFFHKKTEAEIVSLKQYLQNKKEIGSEDHIDKWIRMVATNRLTGHSKGFFSVYTLPPNQAVSQASQIKINKKRNQIPEFKEIIPRIIKKSKSLLRNINDTQRQNLLSSGANAKFYSKNASNTHEISNKSIQLIITSPPFLNIVQYSSDNWLRCWFNSLDTNEIAKKMIFTNSLSVWCKNMEEIFKEIYRILKDGGWLVFEVGELNNGEIKLENHILPIGIKAGLIPITVMINQQNFTKTSNIWGVKNNQKGTNTNRIIIFQKRNNKTRT